jgi:putative transposase
VPWPSRPAAPTTGGEGRRSAETERREALVVAVKAIHGQVKARYGSPRPHAELVARGLPCCVSTVARLMREHGIAAKARRESRCTTDSNHDRPVAESVPDRRFEPGTPDQAWTADITSAATGEGWRYLAVAEDLDPRRIVGRSMGSGIDSRLVVDALGVAVPRRLPGEGLVAHPDRGSRYAGGRYQRGLAGHGIACGMSRRASRWDNAPRESSFASLKEERVQGADDATREEARSSLLEDIEAVSDRVRRHSSLGSMSPTAYERAG